MTRLHVIEGTDKGRSFDFIKGTIGIGRSPENHIKIKDATVSRKHLKFIKKGDQFFIEDLKSKNGTFVNGKQLKPGVIIEIKQGVPIVIGMSVLCLGKGCLEEVKPFLDSINLSQEIMKNGAFPPQQRTQTAQRNVELIYKVNNVLTESRDVNEISEKILGYILDLLLRIDRAFIILIDEKSGEISRVISRSRIPCDDPMTAFSRPLVDMVIQQKQAYLFADYQEAENVGLSNTMLISNIGSLMCVPLVDDRSLMQGVIYVDALSKPSAFRRADLSLLSDLGKRAAIALKNAWLYSSLETESPPEVKIDTDKMS